MADDKEETKETSSDTGYGTVRLMKKAELIGASEDVSIGHKELKK